MITREEAKAYGEDNWDLVAEYNDIINEIYNSFEQHIKSLEAQLSDTKQLTCDGCKHIESKGSCYDCSRYYIDYYQPKDK